MHSRRTSDVPQFHFLIVTYLLPPFVSPLHVTIVSANKSQDPSRVKISMPLLHHMRKAARNLFVFFTLTKRTKTVFIEAAFERLNLKKDEDGKVTIVWIPQGGGRASRTKCTVVPDWVGRLVWVEV